MKLSRELFTLILINLIAMYVIGCAVPVAYSATPTIIVPSAPNVFATKVNVCSTETKILWYQFDKTTTRNVTPVVDIYICRMRGDSGQQNTLTGNDTDSVYVKAYCFTGYNAGYYGGFSADTINLFAYPSKASGDFRDSTAFMLDTNLNYIMSTYTLKQKLPTYVNTTPDTTSVFIDRQFQSVAIVLEGGSKNRKVKGSLVKLCVITGSWRRD